MGKFWAFLFLLVTILCVASFVFAPMYQHWLPVDVSQDGHAIDHLFYFILWLTGAVFIGTEVALFWFMLRYEQSSDRKVVFSHGSHSLEIIWTIIPAATLLFIAIYQMNAWAENKIRNPAAGPDGILGTADDMPPTVEVTARQFEWRLRYPGKNGILGDQDDVHVVNDLRLPVQEEILVDLKSADVLHSFFLPNLRVKQDAVPGMKIPVWFRATQKGSFDIVCAELCGWGHYKMKGRVTFVSRGEYDEWLEQKYREQTATVDSQVAQGDVE